LSIRNFTRVLEAMKAGKEGGATTVLNRAPATEGWSLEDMGFYSHVDILVLNESELAKVCEGIEGSEEELARNLFEKVIQKAVIVTLGTRGAMVVEKGEEEGNEEVIMVA
jgi:sugar/nucleoside kinase (ribokinase family)